jgi:hypothetical protein
MDDKTREELLQLGERLAVAGPDKLQDIIARLRDVAEAQELIASYDNQLFFRGRPKKRYLA